MRQFWDIALEPIVRAVAPRRILEVGVDQGLTTRRLIEFAVAHDVFVDAIDPNPSIDAAEWQHEHPDHVRFHRGLSVDVIPGLDPPDVVLLDGDHNWYTVNSELVLLERQATAAARPPPVVLLHDVQWPYARRDLYYDAGTIPKLHRHPHERAGLLPDRSEVVEGGGLNAHLDHAIFEGGERNGVLTAVEDFLAGSDQPWKLVTVPGLNGLGILAPVARLKENEALRDTIAALGRAPALRGVVALVESERNQTEIRRQAAGRLLRMQEADGEQLAALQREREADAEQLAALQRGREADAEQLAAVQRELEVALTALRDCPAPEDLEQLQRLGREVEELRAARSAARVERDSAEVERDAANAERAALEADRDTAQAQRDAARAERDAALARAAAADAQRQEHADALREAQTGREAAAQRIADADAQAKDALMRADRADARADDAARRHENVESDRHSEQQRRIEAERELFAAAHEQAGLTGRVDAQDRELTGLREEAQGARAQALAAGIEARAAREEADELAQARDRSDRRKQALELREEELEQELVIQRRQLRVATEQHEELGRVNDTLVGRLAALTSAQEEQLEALTRERERLHAAAAEAIAHRETAERGFAEQSTELETLIAARTRQAADAADARESMERALEDLRAEADEAMSALRAARERLEIAEIEGEAREAQLSELQLALGRAHADAEQARAWMVAADARAMGAQQAAPPADVPAAPPAPVPAPPAAASAAVPAAAVEPVPPPANGGPAAAATAIGEPPALRIFPNEYELAAQEYFRREYDFAARAPGCDPIVDPVALAAVGDHHGHVVAEHDDAATLPSADVVVCVHNALADVRTCLWSVVHKTDRPYRLLLVNDGSDAATTEYLEQVAAEVPAVHLIHRADAPHGYTIAANLGMRAATGDYVVLLNSDTIVTRGWLDRIVDCGESDPRIGILGPLSNAASHQSIPDLRDAAGWSTNPLPAFTTPDGIAKLLERVSQRDRPRIPFVNGFCYVIKRAVIDAIGVFDEENFASGYCEENDYSYRAGQAGFELAVVDDGYVFHAKSKSFGVQTRKVIAKRNYEIFLKKHGRERIQEAVKGLEQNTALAPLRAKVSDALSSPFSLVAALDSVNHEALKVMFVLPGIGEGGSGGSHSIYQEVHGMRALGLDARIALRAKSFERARGAYDDADEVFVPYGDADELEQVTAHADVIAATHFKSAILVAELQSRRSDFLPAYYVQDYEPFFTSRDSADVKEAIKSYTLIPGCLLFAKTHWLCNIVSRRHDVFVAKVEPSIDEHIFRPSGARRSGGPLRVTAMVRPRTPRRQPTATVAVLEQLSLERGADVEVTTFGCSQADLERLTDHPPLLAGHRGMLRRTEVADLLAASDVFLDLSMYQAFGRTALEAMACGTTAVVPRLGGVWEFLEHDVNGIAVDAFAPQQVIAALTGLADDRPRLESLQAASRQTGARYSIQRAALSEYLVFAHAHASRARANSSA